MKFVGMLKAVHWAAIGQFLLGAAFVALAREPSLQLASPMLLAIASALGAGGLGTALSAPKVGVEACAKCGAKP